VLLSFRSGAFAAIAAVASLGFACGGGDSLEKVDAEDWVADVCEKARDFDDATSEAVEPLADADEDDSAELKDAIDEMVTGMNKAIDTLIEDVEDVGQPDIEGGDKVIQAFRDHAKEQKEILEDFQSDVNKLDEDDDDFADQLFDVLTDVDETDLRDELEDINENDVDDLIDLIDEDEECAAILFNS